MAQQSSLTRRPNTKETDVELRGFRNATPQYQQAEGTRHPAARETAEQMSLAKKVEEPPVRVHGLPCSIGHLLDTLEGAELEAFKVMLGTPDKPGWDASALYDAVRDEGHHIGRQSISRHRRGKCRCNA